MPCIWGQHNRSQIFLDVAILDIANLSLGSIGSVNLTTAPSVFRALIDTGAQGTMISPNVVRTLGLQAQGQVPIQGIGPIPTYHNAYLFHVGFVIAFTIPGPSGGFPQQLMQQANILPIPIYGAEITSANGVFDVLLGMDVLSTGILSVQGNGMFSFAY